MISHVRVVCHVVGMGPEQLLRKLGSLLCPHTYLSMRGSPPSTSHRLIRPKLAVALVLP